MLTAGCLTGLDVTPDDGGSTIRLHDVTSLKKVPFMVTATRTSNPEAFSSYGMLFYGLLAGLIMLFTLRMDAVLSS